MRFDTKVAVAVRGDLPTWQKLNVVAFTISGVAATEERLMGLPYEDGSGTRYLPMLGQPVLVFKGDGAELRAAYERAMAAGVRLAIYTEELFRTGNDIDNRAAVKAKGRDELALVGLAFRAPRKAADRILAGLALHD
jgi:hypothetical protein